MKLSGKTVAVLAEDQFEDIELLYPYYRLLEEGAKVLVVGSGGAQSYRGKHEIDIAVTVQAIDVDPASIAAVIVPGGYAPDRMRRHADMISLVRGYTTRASWWPASATRLGFPSRRVSFAASG